MFSFCVKHLEMTFAMNWHYANKMNYTEKIENIALLKCMHSHVTLCTGQMNNVVITHFLVRMGSIFLPDKTSHKLNKAKQSKQNPKNHNRNQVRFYERHI